MLPQASLSPGSKLVVFNLTRHKSFKSCVIFSKHLKWILIFKKNLYAIKKTAAFYFSIELILVDILKITYLCIFIRLKTFNFEGIGLCKIIKGQYDHEMMIFLWFESLHSWKEFAILETHVAQGCGHHCPGEMVCGQELPRGPGKPVRVDSVHQDVAGTYGIWHIKTSFDNSGMSLYFGIILVCGEVHNCSGWMWLLCPQWIIHWLPVQQFVFV